MAEAIIGIGERCGMEPVFIMDTEKCIECLMKQGMNREEAQEYFDFNTLGAYVGASTPIYMSR